MRSRLETGFSTLEVIAAVAIIAVALVPIAALQVQLARTQARLVEIQTDSTDVRNALALLRDINPMLTPTGQRRLDDQTNLIWTSAPASSLRPSVNPAGFEVQLYRVSGAIARGDGSVTSLQLDMVGWRPGSEARE